MRLRNPISCRGLRVRLAHTGRYWRDRPAIGQIPDMIDTGTYDFEAPPLRRGPH